MSGLRDLMASRRHPVVSSRAPRFDPPHARTVAAEVLYNQLSNALADAAATHASGRLLDIGCGTKPWAPLFAPRIAEHVGIDPEPSPSGPAPDVVADAYAVPLDDASADTVLLTEVLEHLDDPVRALREAHRLLRPGGAIIVTTPLFFPVHGEPRDFFRYTAHGLEHVLLEAGFEGIDVRPLSGQWTTLAMLRGHALLPFRRGRVTAAVIDAFTACTLAVAVRLDELDFRDAFSWNHIAVARKP